MKFESVNRKYQKLNDFIRGEMRRQKVTQEALAYRLNITPISVSNKLNGKTEWSAREIINIYEFLGIEDLWTKKKPGGEAPNFKKL